MNKLGCRWRAAEKGAGSRLASIAAIHARPFLERQSVQEQIVNQTEDRGVETDPERERHDSNQSKSR
jgi:hypothetical protein